MYVLFIVDASKSEDGYLPLLTACPLTQKLQEANGTNVDPTVSPRLRKPSHQPTNAAVPFPCASLHKSHFLALTRRDGLGSTGTV